MRLKEIMRAVLGVLCISALVLAAGGSTWEWDGSGGTDSWSLCPNWTVLAGMPQVCYPSTGNDDVIIPTAGSAWDVDLITDTIDDLTIEDDVNFGADSGTPTLTVDSFSISGPAIVTITGATIVTN